MTCPRNSKYGSSFGAKITPVNRDKVDCASDGLQSFLGAQQVIATIKARYTVESLILPHNELGNDGCIVLFEFLSSPLGRKHPVSHINLGSNKVGNPGLLAIAEYLKNNRDIKTLLLQNNIFSGDPSVAMTFANAVNSSSLESLHLSSNDGLSDTFAQHFLPSLASPCLHELSLSATRISPLSLPHIVDYLSSPRCWLRTFNCSANTLGTLGVTSITDAIKRCNYRVDKVNLYSNHAGAEDINSPQGLEEWLTTYTYLTSVISRNTCLRHETENEALLLLRHARPLLLHGIRDPGQELSSLPTPCDISCSCFSSSGSTLPESSTAQTNQVLPSQRLPTEIKHYILSFLAPILTPTQRIRIYHYASSPTTLPQLLPCLPTSNPTISSPRNMVCVPDPSSLGFGTGRRVWNTGGVELGGGCAIGKCMGSHNSVICHRERDKANWLAAVGCDSYDPER